MVINSDRNLSIHIITALSNKNSDMSSFECDYCDRVDEIHYFESKNPNSAKNTCRLCKWCCHADSSPRQNYKVTTLSPGKF